MSAPLCPVHGVPMRPSNRGTGFYCTQKNDDGSYCKERAAAVQPARPAAVAAPVPATGTSTQSANTMLMAACLYNATITGQTPEAAVQIYQTLKKAAL